MLRTIGNITVAQELIACLFDSLSFQSPEVAIVGEEMGSHLQGSESFFYVIIFCFFVCLCVWFLGLGGLSYHWDFQTKAFGEPFNASRCFCCHHL